MSGTTRRDFLKGALTAGGMGILFLTDSRTAFTYAANEKLNIAGIGVGGKGHSDVAGCACQGDNVIALCDASFDRAAGAFRDWPNAKKYHDFRRMFDDMGDKIDVVSVSTPDHFHAIAAVTAMRMGKHVYCQKPLTRTIYESRLMRETARKYKVATQMGNQGTAETGLREAVEIIQAGALGKIKEVHIWSNRPVWPQGCIRPADSPPIPKELDWDVWLGPAPKRPYNPCYLPFAWRGWIDFGAGAIGDMGCHTMNMPFMALDLSNPISIEAEVHDKTAESYPKQSKVHYTFAHSNALQPRTVTWYDGGMKPPARVLPGRDMPGSGCVIIGEEGYLFTPDDYGSHYELFPKEKFDGYKKPVPTLPRSIGHYEEFLRACRGGEAAMSNFDYASALTEFALLGNLAVIVGEPIYWDSKNMRAINCPKADYYINTPYRKGWTL